MSESTPTTNLRTKKPKCLYPPCHQAPTTRGLCPTHYNAAKRYIKAGSVSWEQLIAADRALEVTKSTGERSGPVKKWFLDAPAIAASKAPPATP